MSMESNVESYYTRGRLEDSILQGADAGRKGFGKPDSWRSSGLGRVSMPVAAKLPKNWLLKWSCVRAYTSLMWEAGSAGQLATLLRSTDAELQEWT